MTCASFGHKPFWPQLKLFQTQQNTFRPRTKSTTGISASTQPFGHKY